MKRLHVLGCAYTTRDRSFSAGYLLAFGALRVLLLRAFIFLASRAFLRFQVILVGEAITQTP